MNSRSESDSISAKVTSKLTTSKVAWRQARWLTGRHGSMTSLDLLIRELIELIIERVPAALTANSCKERLTSVMSWLGGGRGTLLTDMNRGRGVTELSANGVPRHLQLTR